MAVNKFNQPNYGAQSGTAYPTAIDDSTAALAQSANQFAPSAQDTPNMTVRVAAGFIQQQNGLAVIAAQNSPTFTAPTANPRIDWLLMSEVGALSILQGVESATPTAPSLFENYSIGLIPICQVSLTVGMTQISNNAITDFRPLISQAAHENFGIASKTTTPALILYGLKAAAAGQSVGAIHFHGRDSGTSTDIYGSIVVASKDHTSGSEDGEFLFQTSINGSASTPMTLADGVQLGTPTGGYKGLGTLNAQAVYDDNVLLTCYPLEASNTGRIDLEKWDAKAPSGKHELARKFLARLGTEHDPLTVEGYTRHWHEKGHLTALPNEARMNHGDLSTGEWIQRLLETVECQAIHIAELHERLKKLEAK